MYQQQQKKKNTNVCYKCALYLNGQYKLVLVAFTGKTSMCDCFSMKGTNMQLYI